MEDMWIAYPQGIIVNKIFKLLYLSQWNQLQLA